MRTHRERDDDLGRERSQTLVRILIGTFVLLYLYAGRRFEFAATIPAWYAIGIGYFLFSIAVAAWTWRDRASKRWRRTIMNAADVSIISFMMIAAERVGIPLFVFYLWITLGNGFRYGIRAMTISAVFSLAGFATVIALSPTWQDMTMVSIAIVASLILLPAYSSYGFRPRRCAEKTSDNKNASSISVAAALARQMFIEHAKEAIKRIRLRRHDELGREQGQSIVRVVISSSVLAYLIASHQPMDFSGSLPGWLVFLASFILFSTAVTVHALRDTQSRVVRRTITNAGDVIAISYLMASTDETGIPLFVLYLWITLGNGFRFGVKAMVVSGVLCLIGFGAVIATSELWRSHPMLSTGVIAGLLLIPGYTAHLIRQLHLARQRAEEASAAKSNFLARMSHELRTPLNGILGTTELLSASKRFDREEKSLLNVIRDSVKVSMRQIDNVLDFSKMEAGKLQIEQIDFDMHELMNRTVRLVRGIATDKQLRLMLRMDPTVPYRLVGDPHHVQEVLINLMSNAIKFTDRGYVSVDVSLVRETEQSALVRIAVHDTGIGIDPQALTRIFEAFSQEDVGTTRRYGGTGLGTTIAKQLVELMGGRMSVASTKGKGSTFTAEILFGRQTARPRHDDRLTGARAILISKNITVQDRLARFAQEQGVALQAVATPAEAEGLLRRGIRIGNPINIVFADSDAVLTCAGAHCADDFLSKAILAATPVYLIADVTPDDGQLRQWGYAGALSYDLPVEALFNVVHASTATEFEEGVARIEPWALTQPHRQKARLLVADDNRTNLMIMRKILETANFDVDTAENGEQALEMMLRTRYKAAVVDMHMPGLDGIAVIKQYRMMHHGARTPIVMLTANATVDAKLESAEAGADAYLTKPATATAIVSTIERLLDDTEVHELERARPAEPAAQEVPILDTSLITELDRLYNNPSGLNQILDEFESESRRLLDGISRAIWGKNHAAFCDLVHALKGNGANLGAMRLAQTCQEAEAYGMLDFRREGEQIQRRLENALAEAVKALREFTATSEPAPAKDSDSP